MYHIEEGKEQYNKGLSAQENKLNEKKSTQKETSQDSIFSSAMTGNGSFNQSGAGGRKADMVTVQHLLGCESHMV